ncbi:MAG TPA: peptidylprolyl isomerase [Candidatus Nanoarchaeia archaeon]|nr:peptidylprolyl isomerase [Candidatus Nanoarchaeia archaeon]
MTDTVQQGDFVQVEYNGYLAEDNSVFDTTDENLAKQQNIHGKNSSYGPVTICIGEHQLIKGIDEELVGKLIGSSHTFTLSPERAFGKKDAKLIQLIPTQKFMKEGIRPMPGMQITVDNMLGVVKSVSGGRTLVDFNHPLSGRAVRYEVRVLKKISDPAAQLQSYLQRTLQLKTMVKLEGEKAMVEVPFEMPEELRGEYVQRVQKLIPSITSLQFIKTENTFK